MYNPSILGIFKNLPLIDQPTTGDDETQVLVIKYKGTDTITYKKLNYLKIKKLRASESSK